MEETPMARFVLRSSSNRKQAIKLRKSLLIFGLTQMDMVDVFARKEILSPRTATAAQLQNVPAPTFELPNLENGDGQVAVTEVGMFNEPNISHRGHEKSGADMIGDDGRVNARSNHPDWRSKDTRRLSAVGLERLQHQAFHRIK
ncbi:hypothetical protein PV05_08969 [Exophiala xenobiotica]|uniref:Uncharacterized protein n=1 Tax=Exophiala xenobiotica TaxID=348802 RepID=A0A0D2BLH3_9EURO|nr:uncharacterized protein PV05_08969 [Exophiala xenobiotica]KIW53391.1 hypothetical protein PV05_08969 [Exophiala xenobiotica]